MTVHQKTELSPILAGWHSTELQGYRAFLDSRTQLTLVVDLPVRLPDAAKRFTFSIDGKTHIAVRSVSQLDGAADADMVTLPGTLQRALGEAEWQPGGRTTRMKLEAPDVYTLAVRLPAGTYSYKVARGGTWSDNVGKDFKQGGDNIEVTVKQAGIVRFVVDYEHKTIRNSISDPETVPTPTKEERWLPSTVAETRYLSLVLAAPVPKGIAHKVLTLTDAGTKRIYPVHPRGILDQPEYCPAMMDLTPKCSRTGIVIRTWSPVAHAVEIELRSGMGFAQRAMRNIGYGVWEYRANGDFHLRPYRFVYHHTDRIVHAVDVHSRAATPDAQWSISVDMSRTNPTGWENDRPIRIAQQTDAILYEAHIRDLTTHPGSGVPEPLRGTYSGLAMSTSNPVSGEPTGINHLVRLGITHLHLLPFQNFNPEHSRDYNWGYETTLFDVPEEQYATRPGDSERTIREVKQLVQALHRSRIGLVMDVVYNHSIPASGDSSAFWAAVPYYWFRTDHEGNVINESGVGNALNDERTMVRKFICDSIGFWAREYHIDGFRFDLLGIFTPATAKAVRKLLDVIRPGIILYGEPWSGGGPIRLGKGDQRGTGVAVFNDTFRGLFRGDLDGDGKGVLTGASWDPAAMLRVLRGSPDFAALPAESVNYISAHDNMTLRDKLARVFGTGPDSDRVDAAVRAGISVTMLAHGIPFIEGGIEIGRTKGGNHNSYNAGDKVNQYVWRTLTPADAQCISHISGLAAVRKAHPAFRSNTRLTGASQIKLLRTGLPEHVLAWELDGAAASDPWKAIRVIINLSQKRVDITGMERWQLGYSDDALGLRASAGAGMIWQLEPGGTVVLHNS